MIEGEFKLKFGLFILLLWVFTLPLYSASFDCNRATTATEKAICANPELSAQDELLARSLKQLLKKFPADK